MGSVQEGVVIEIVRSHDADLAQKILDEMFVFENLLEVDDRGIQLILREVQSESLLLHLKARAKNYVKKYSKYVSTRWRNAARRFEWERSSQGQ